MYALAGRLDPDTLPRAGPGHLRGDGAGRGDLRRRVPLPAPRARRTPVRTTRTRWATALHRRRRRGRHPDHPAGHPLPVIHSGWCSRWPAPQLRFGDGDVTAWARPVGRDYRAGDHAPDRRGGPFRPRGAGPGSGRVRRADRRPGRCTCTCPNSGPRTRPAWPCTAAPRRDCWPTRVCSGPASPPCTRPTSPEATVPCWATRSRRCVCAPPPNGTSADGIGPARALADAGAPLCLGSDSHAVIDLFEEARAVELQRAAAHRAPGPLQRGRAADRRDRRPATPRSAGPTPA